jgi:hypothetical protein
LTLVVAVQEVLLLVVLVPLEELVHLGQELVAEVEVAIIMLVLAMAVQEEHQEVAAEAEGLAPYLAPPQVVQVVLAVTHKLKYGYLDEIFRSS